MGTSKRYANTYDQRTAEKIAAAPLPPCTLPVQAYGPNPLEWASKPAPVWAWISWPDRPAERVPATAKGWNDRVVVVEWITNRGTRNTVVWRNAVTRRVTSSSS